MSDDHERIWLESVSLDGRYGCEGRLWCQDKVWPENEGEPEPTEYIRADIVAALRAELAAAKERAEKAEGERDESRGIVRDIYWMALRYADGRQTYAPSMCNDALRKAYDAGWLVHQHQSDPAFARDGSAPEYASLVARALAAEAKAEGLAKAVNEIASQPTVGELCADFGEDYEGDWQDGYEHCVACARTALTAYRTEKERVAYWQDVAEAAGGRILTLAAKAEGLAKAAALVVSRHAEWRKCMPDDWAGDPLSDAIAALAAYRADKDTGL